MSTATPSKPMAPRGLRRVEKTGLISVMVASVLVILLCIAAGIVNIVQALNGTALLFLPTDYSPGDFAAQAPGQIANAQFDGVFALMVEGVQSPGLTLYAWTMGVGFALMIAIFAFTFHLCVRLYRGQPFGRLMTRGFAALSVITIVVTLVAPAVFSQAHTQIVTSMGIDLAQAPFSTGYSFEAIDALSLAGGIFLALLAGAFHIGSRLQRDAEGLV